MTIKQSDGFSFTPTRKQRLPDKRTGMLVGWMDGRYTKRMVWCALKLLMTTRHWPRCLCLWPRGEQEMKNYSNHRVSEKSHKMWCEIVIVIERESPPPVSHISSYRFTKRRRPRFSLIQCVTLASGGEKQMVSKFQKSHRLIKLCVLQSLVVWLVKLSPQQSSFNGQLQLRRVAKNDQRDWFSKLQLFNFNYRRGWTTRKNCPLVVLLFSSALQSTATSTFGAVAKTVCTLPLPTFSSVTSSSHNVWISN